MRNEESKAFKEYCREFKLRKPSVSELRAFYRGYEAGKITGGMDAESRQAERAIAVLSGSILPYAPPSTLGSE